MKQFKLYSGMAAVCAMLTLASCGNDIELTEAQAPVKGEYKVTITASQESNVTRTAVDGANVVWQEGDAITVFDGAGVACPFELAKGAGETLGEFEGTITVTEPKKYCAVYPLEPEATILSAADLVQDNMISADEADESATYIDGLILPDVQTATPDGFDPLAAIMTARNDNADKITSTSEDLSLGEFKHVCAFVKVTTTEPYDKITFTANGGDSIAGGFMAEVGADGVSRVIPTSPTCTVSLVPAVEGTKIAAGTYFIAILPGTLEEGFTMSCSSIDSENKEVTTMMRSFTGTVSAFSRHNVVNMGTVEETQTHVTWVRSTHDYVDLGLSVKWATCNVGATSPEGYGDYFAWGETSPKDYYDWSTYSFNPSGDGSTFTKYTGSDASMLAPEDDAAAANWGGLWRMPTEAELTELFENCYWEWTEDYGNTNSDNPVKGFIIYKAKDTNDKGVKKYKGDSNTTTVESYDTSTDNHIFLPAASGRSESELGSVGSSGLYWSASLNEDDTYTAWSMMFSTSNAFVYDSSRFTRYFGFPVRPVLP